jgi:hypothetical protein
VIAPNATVRAAKPSRIRADSVRMVGPVHGSPAICGKPGTGWARRV